MIHTRFGVVQIILASIAQKVPNRFLMMRHCEWSIGRMLKMFAMPFCTEWLSYRNDSHPISCIVYHCEWSLWRMLKMFPMPCLYGMVVIYKWFALDFVYHYYYLLSLVALITLMTLATCITLYHPYHPYHPCQPYHSYRPYHPYQPDQRHKMFAVRCLYGMVVIARCRPSSLVSPKKVLNMFHVMHHCEWSLDRMLNMFPMPFRCRVCTEWLSYRNDSHPISCIIIITFSSLWMVLGQNA